MAAKEERSSDFYEVLGLKKECSDAELRNAYKKLALKWHPDRCSSSGNSKCVEEAKKKFQAIQEAYSGNRFYDQEYDALLKVIGVTRGIVDRWRVLSDANKRFLYDVGVYDCDDDNDENGMGDFLNEMAAMMTQNKSSDNHEESFEDLQEIFEEMFQSDIQAFTSSSRTSSSACSTSFFTSCSDSSNVTSKRNSSEMSSGYFEANTSQFEGFCLGVEHQGSSSRGRGACGRTRGRGGSSRRGGRKQKVSSAHDVSSVR